MYKQKVALATAFIVFFVVGSLYIKSTYETENKVFHFGQIHSNMMAHKWVIVIPSTLNRICDNFSQLARASINPQTLQPFRIIVGIATRSKVKSKHLECFKVFKSLLKVPLTVAISNERGSPGASRNIALSQVLQTERIFLHDDDDYLHFQALELLQYLFTKHTQIDVIVASYLYKWKHSQVPWCIGNFENVAITDNIASNSNGLQVVGNPLCDVVAHGFPAFRQNPIRQFEVKYSNELSRGEDGNFLVNIIQKSANVLHACFPILAYKSTIPTTIDTLQDNCTCFNKFSQCKQI